MSIFYNAKGLTLESFKDYQHLMNMPTGHLSFAKGISSNYCQFIKNPKISKNGQASGQAFEVAVGDALCKLFEGKLTSDIRIVPCLKLKSRNAEIDYVVHNDRVAHLLFLKTSFRERWKQEDRDAMVFTRDNHYPELTRLLGVDIKEVQCWALGFKERPNMTDAQAVTHMRTVGQNFAGVPENNVMSVLDEPRMKTLAAALQGLTSK